MADRKRVTFKSIVWPILDENFSTKKKKLSNDKIIKIVSSEKIAWIYFGSRIWTVNFVVNLNSFENEMKYLKGGAKVFDRQVIIMRWEWPWTRP